MSKPFANLDARTVDEQIEQSLHAVPDQPRNEDERCIQDLQYLYRKGRILAQAQQRLMIASPAGESMVSVEMSGEDGMVQQNNTLFSQPHTPIRHKAFAWPKLAAALAAAVLLVATLFGAAQFFNARSQSTAGHGHPGGASISTIVPTPTSTARVLFSDPLSANTHNWPVKDGQYFFQDGAYHVAGSTAQSSAALLPGFTLVSPWSYTLTMKQVRGDITSPMDTFGMIFAYTRTNGQGKHVIRFYTLELAPASKGSELMLWKYDNDTSRENPWTEVWHGTATVHKQLGQANTLKVTATTDALTFTVNGEIAGTVSNIRLDGGQIGMLVNSKGAEVAFKNLLVTRP